MNYKKLLLALILISTLNNLSAQLQVGFSAGANLANARFELNEKTTSHSFLTRLNIGADLGYFFSEHWAVQSGVYYAGKGWRERYNLGFDTVVTRLDYIEVPVKMGYRFQETNERSVVVSGGVYGAYGINGKTTFRNSPELTTDPFKEGRFKRFDLGYVIESSYRITNNYGAKISYSHGLLSLERPDDKLKNYLFNFSLSVVIK